MQCDTSVERMPSIQEQYDDAMFDFSQAEYAKAISKLQSVLIEHPDHFESQLALGMALYRQGDYAAAIAEGHKAEQLQPREQLVHTNLSLFYMKAGDKQKAEHHGLQARLAGWRDNMAPPAPGTPLSCRIASLTSPACPSTARPTSPSRPRAIS